jgi:hypothetical protein
VAMVLFGAVSCDKRVQGPSVPEKLIALAQNVAEAKGSQGFVCAVDDANRLFCVCDESASDDNAWSCTGMEKMCGVLGTGRICDPSTNFCVCHARQ